MPCDPWREKMDAYVDGELSPAEARELSAHLRECAACANDVLSRVQLKRSVAVAGKRYEPSAQLRAKVASMATAKPQRTRRWQWQILAVPAMILLIVSIAFNFYASREGRQRQRVYSELADLHVAALASASPVDVLSTDRHTVKPWFQGKIPFTFNLPELQGSEFTLIGGRVTYLEQAPGAHLIYRIRQHEISVFIFQERDAEIGSLPSGAIHALSFNAQSWEQEGLRYFVIGDVNASDVAALSKLLLEAN